MFAETEETMSRKRCAEKSVIYANYYPYLRCSFRILYTLKNAEFTVKNVE